MRSIIKCSIVLFFLVSFMGCQKKEESAPPPPPKVIVAPPLVKEVTRYAYFTGYTAPTDKVDLLARVEGFLSGIHYKVGGLVEKGDLLFTIEPDQFKARLLRAEANLKAMETETELAEATYKRTQRAYESKAVSELSLLQSKAAFATAQSAVAGAATEVTDAQLNLSYTKIYAPVDGKMSRNIVDVGNLVGAGGSKTLLASLVKYDPIYTYFNIDEASYMRYKNQQAKNEDGNGLVQVDLALEGQKDYPYSGEADYADPSVDRDTGTVQIRAVFANDDLFITPGQFAKVRIPLSTKDDTLLVPEVALSTDQRGRYLLTVDQSSVVHYKLVTVGQSMLDGTVVIEEGLQAEDQVIVSGLQRVRPGMTVTVEQQSKATK